MINIFSRVHPAQIEMDPFPHVVLDQAFDDDTYRLLTEQFPSSDVIRGGAGPIGNNCLYLMPASEVLLDHRISEACREFFEYHVSSEFWRSLLPLLRPALLAVNPALEVIAGRPLDDFRTTMRRRDARFTEEVSLDCQFGINSPVTRPSSVRSPHIDRPNKLFNALLYCRAPDDDTPGGELILYRAIRSLAYGAGSSIMHTRIVEAKRIAYRANRLVLFLNSPWSVHGVAPRPITAHLRRYVNFMCEYREPLFEIERLPAMRRIVEALGASVIGGSPAKAVEG